MRLKKLLINTWNKACVSLSELLFPQFCVNCGYPGTYICKSCEVELSKLTQVCIVCKKGSLNGKTHPKCQSATNIVQLITPFKYNTCIARLLSAYKYKGGYMLATFIAALIATRLRYFKVSNCISTAITAIPLAQNRQNSRGYNQSQLLAKLIAKQLQIPFIETLTRTSFRKAQATTAISERKANIKNAFVKIPNTELPYKNLIIFDDVITTGATLTEAAKCFKSPTDPDIIAMCFATAIDKH